MTVNSDQRKGYLIQGAGDAGTADPGVVTVQGIAGGTVIPVSLGALISAVNIDQYGGVATTLGQKVMASSIPVVIASNQSAVTITGTVLAVQSGVWNPTVDVSTWNASAGLTMAVALSDTMANPLNPLLGSATMGWDPINSVWGRVPLDVTALSLITRQRVTPSFVSVAGGANAIATLTIPASGAGLFHHITYIHISRVATAALAGGALLTVTTTNLIGNPTWRTGNVMVAGGTTTLIDQTFPNPIRSSVANTATTIVGPAAGAAVSWHITVGYYDSASTR